MIQSCNGKVFFSSNHGGKGWKAYTANIGFAFAYAFCGMCLTATGRFNSRVFYLYLEMIKYSSSA
jgi:hypothetical protein